MNNHNNFPFQFEQAEPEKINFSELLYKYLAYWKWFVLSLALSLAGGFFYLKKQTPLYTAQSSVLLKDDKNGLGTDDMLKQLNGVTGTKVVDNEIDILKSYTLLEKVVTDLNLQVQYFKKENLKDVELYGQSSPVTVKIVKASENPTQEPLELKILDDKTFLLNGKAVALNKAIDSPYGVLQIGFSGNASDVKEVTIKLNTIPDVTENLIRDINIASSSKASTVLVLSLDSPVPQKGIDILNKLIEVYSQASLEDKNRVAANTLDFIENRLLLVSADLTDVEKNVESFKSSEGITDLSTEAQLFLGSVQANDQQLNQIRIQQSVLENIEGYVQRKGNTSGTVPATLGISDPTLLALINQLVELENKREQTVKLVKEDNPIMRSLDDQISNTKAGLAENIVSLQNNLAITRKKLEDQNSRIENSIKSIPSKERKLVDITRQQVIKNNLYTFLLQKREETALSYASTVSDSRIIDKARSKYKPMISSSLVYILFASMGVFITIGIILCIDLLSNKIRSRKEIEKSTRTPILAEVAFADHQDALVVSKDGRTAIAEQIRALRTNLAFITPGENAQSILFTSGMSGEGKSFISLNLGASLAMIDKKTIILEMDLRKPKLHTSLNIPNNVGISNYLAGQAELIDIIQTVPEQENYYIITCGTIPPNPAELLAKGRLEELFQKLRASFDYIIIDAPPVGVVTDAQIIEQYADATIYILRHNYTYRSHLKLVDNLYREKRFKNFNLVLNSVNEKAGYGYGNRYGYGYGYQQEKKTFFSRYQKA
jgi:tyrosine-protein kinase Etk/Wzc